MGKRKGLILLGLSAFILVGCNMRAEKDFKLAYEKLSNKEEYLLDLTGNKVHMYNIKNFPTNKRYELQLIYEVYNKGEKIKEEIMTGILSDGIVIEGEKNSIDTLGINIQEGKIRTILARDGIYTSSEYEIEEDIRGYAQNVLVEDIDLEFGKDVYIFYADSGNKTSGSLIGLVPDEKEFNDIIKNSDKNIFIKLRLQEN